MVDLGEKREKQVYYLIRFSIEAWSVKVMFGYDT